MHGARLPLRREGQDEKDFTGLNRPRPRLGVLHRARSRPRRGAWPSPDLAFLALGLVVSLATVNRRSACWLLLLGAFALSGCGKGSSDPPSAALTRFTRANAQAVFLAGDFNDWSATATPMQRARDGTWVAELPLPPGTYQYKFVADGQWERDLANPATAPDGWGGENSVVTVPSVAQNAPAAKANPSAKNPPPAVRPEARWSRIYYPHFPIPGAEHRTISALVSGGTSDIPGQAPRLRFDLLFEEKTGDEMPASLAQPETFVVRLHLADGNVFDSTAASGNWWEGAGNQTSMTRSRIYFFPWTRNAYDEAWIEWRLAGQTFWFELPYGFTRDPAQPWPPAEPDRAAPQLAPAMQNLPAQDRLVPWLSCRLPAGRDAERTKPRSADGQSLSPGRRSHPAR